MDNHYPNELDSLMLIVAVIQVQPIFYQLLSRDVSVVTEINTVLGTCLVRSSDTAKVFLLWATLLIS